MSARRGGVDALTKQEQQEKAVVQAAKSKLTHEASALKQQEELAKQKQHEVESKLKTAQKALASMPKQTNVPIEAVQKAVGDLSVNPGNTEADDGVAEIETSPEDDAGGDDNEDAMSW